MKLLGYHRWRYSVILAPYKAYGLCYFLQLIAQIVADGRACKSYDFQCFYAVVDNTEHLVYQFFGSHFRVVKCKFCFFLNIIIVAAFWVCLSHSVFKQTGTAGKGNRLHQFAVLEREYQTHMTAQ